MMCTNLTERNSSVDAVELVLDHQVGVIGVEGKGEFERPATTLSALRYQEEVRHTETQS